MISWILCRLRRKKELRRWREMNSHNETVMNNEFDMNLVHVGKCTYGELNILNHSEKNQVIIGNYCSIASNVTFIACADHPINTISTFPFKVKCLHSVLREAISKGDIIIEDDVWIGQNAIVLSGVRVGQGAVIAAGSVVTKDIPPYSVVGGNPARVIKYRFEEKIVNELLKVDFGKLDDFQIASHIEDLYIELTSKEQLEWLPKKEF